jgi:hypothetical protein
VEGHSPTPIKNARHYEPFLPFVATAPHRFVYNFFTDSHFIRLTMQIIGMRSLPAAQEMAEYVINLTNGRVRQETQGLLTNAPRIAAGLKR